MIFSTPKNQWMKTAMNKWKLDQRDVQINCKKPPCLHRWVLLSVLRVKLSLDQSTAACFKNIRAAHSDSHLKKSEILQAKSMSSSGTWALREPQRQVNSTQNHTRKVRIVYHYKVNTLKEKVDSLLNQLSCSFRLNKIMYITKINIKVDTYIILIRQTLGGEGREKERERRGVRVGGLRERESALVKR